MKKAIQILFFSLLVLTFTSCSSNDESGTSAVLLKKLTYSSFGTNAEYKFAYKGTKLTKVTYAVDNISNGSGYEKYFYTGELITEIKRYDKNNHYTINTVFTYDASNKLMEVKRLEFDRNYGLKTVFQYNADGSVESTGYYGDIETQNTANNIVQMYHFQNGDIVSMEYTSPIIQYSYDYIYDSANHPLKNVTGLKAIRIYDSIADGLFGFEHNLIQESQYDGNGDVVFSVSFGGDYNQDNYPVAIYSIDAPENSGYNFQY